MANVPESESKLLAIKSGDTCAFPGCTRRLTLSDSDARQTVVTGQVAHIVARQREGPRGADALPETERNKYPNLIYLCSEHHNLVDGLPLTYSVQVLRQMKADHEARVESLIQVGKTFVPPSRQLMTEGLLSTLFPVTHLPRFVYSAPCSYSDRQEDKVKAAIEYPEKSDEIIRFLLREGRLYSFHKLSDTKGPFNRVVNSGSVTRLTAEELWQDPEGARRYMTLLNRALYRHCGLLGVHFDPEHHRFYFVPKEKGKAREVEYRTLNKKDVTRKVVWRPTTRATGEFKRFWWHYAAGLKFRMLGERLWCFSIRPERRITIDGETPLRADKIGRRVTTLKARMYNMEYLKEVQFWRDYLSQGEPRIIMRFGGQSAIIDVTQIVHCDVKSPGIPEDKASFRQETYRDDLFSLHDLEKAVGGTADEEEEYADE